MKKLIRATVAFIMALSVILAIPAYALAIGYPASDPYTDDIWAWRNVLETGDQLYIILENTPYALPPTDYTYPEAYIWRFYNGATELAQATGYDYHADGYGWNVIGFYFDAASAPAWAGAYDLKLSGSPTAFAIPKSYTYNITAGAYSALTDMDDVKADIANTIINIATSLYSKWGLTSVTSLVAETETATVLSALGQTFFRGAIYGLQGMAPAAFPLTVISYTITTRTWSDNYTNALEAQHAGTDIETMFNAGEALLDVDYNLLGLIIALVIAGGLIVANWMIAGGNLWKGIIEGVPVMVIGTRMALVGLGELALIAALCMLYINARIWKLI